MQKVTSFFPKVQETCVGLFAADRVWSISDDSRGTGHGMNFYRGASVPHFAANIEFDRLSPGSLIEAYRVEAEAYRRVIGEVESEEDASYETTFGRIDQVKERVKRLSALCWLYGNQVGGEEATTVAEAARLIDSDLATALYTNPAILAQAERILCDPTVALSSEERRFVEELATDLRTSGAALPPASRSRLGALNAELATLEARFEANLVRSRERFSLTVRDEADLAGLTAPVIAAAARAAADSGDADAWRFTLDAPSYHPFMEQSERRDLRRKMYEAHSALGAADGEDDNRPLVERILSLRLEIAQLLGHRSYQSYALEDTMAGSPDRLRAFVAALESGLGERQEREFALLAQAGSEAGIDRVEPWDEAFLMERVRTKTGLLDTDTMRAYLDFDRVTRGLFSVLDQVFDVRLVETKEPVWHEDVRVFEALRGDCRLATVYLDPFARDGKMQGAWAIPLRTGGPTDRGHEPHALCVSMNLRAPDAEGRVPMTHREMEILFHEFGHALHVILSNVSVRDLGGINVPRDFCEVPSQLLENWAWDPVVLSRVCQHADTGAALPEETFQALVRGRYFFAALRQSRQLWYVLADAASHAITEPVKYADLARVTRELEERVGRREARDSDHLLTSFPHLFSGGYGATYYAYLWSEAIEARIAAWAVDTGLLTRETGEKLERAILSRGNASEPARMIQSLLGLSEPAWVADPAAVLERGM